MRFRYDKDNEEFVVTSSTILEYNQLKLWLTRYAKNYKYSPQYKKRRWDGRISFFRNGKINLGLWFEIIKSCKTIDAPFIIENKEDVPINRNINYEDVKNFCEEYFKDHKIKNSNNEYIDFKPYEHQIETAFKILKYRYCISEVATSGGKTLIISIIIFYILKKINPDAKFLIIVPSINLVTQFYNNIIEYNYGINVLDKYNNNIKNIKSDDIENKYCDIRIEEIMSDNPRKYHGDSEPNIYIGTYQSLEKMPKSFFRQFYCVVSDEAHKVKARTLNSILKKTFKCAHYRFGLSGTFPNNNSCEILSIQSVLGPKISEITADELKRRGLITPVEIRAIIMNHNDIEFVKKLNDIKKKSNSDKIGRYLFEMEKNYIHESDKRIEFIKKIISKCTKNTLMLFNTINYGKKLYEKLKNDLNEIDFYYIDGSINNKNRELIKNEMEITNSKLKVLIASYGTLSTGVSIKSIGNIIFAESLKSEQVIIQSIGRALRLHENKNVAVIFDLVDIYYHNYNNILYRQFNERLKFYNKRKYPYKIIKILL